MNKLALLLTLAVATAAHAQGAPGTISFVARLADGGTPITGAHDLDVALFDANTGGTAVWSETRTGVTIPSDGILYLDLGSVTPLDANVFSGGKKYLEVTIDSQITTPRIVIESAPYAIRSGEAGHAADSDSLGTHPASFYQARVSNACSSGSAIASIDAGGGVVCQPVPTYTAGTGLLLVGSAFSVDTSTIQARVSNACAAGAIASISSTGAITCLTAGNGLLFSTGQFQADFSTTQHAITPCPAGSLLTKADSNGNATCYTPGFGIQFDGTSAWVVNPATVQKRVTGTCANGAISSVNQDGSVNCSGGTSPAFQTTNGAQTTGSTSYVSLTGGPAVTATIGASGNALVTVTGGIQPVSGKLAYMAVEVDSSPTSDTNALVSDTNFLQASATFVITGLTAGNHTFTVQYRTNGGGAASFSNRTLVVTPL